MRKPDQRGIKPERCSREKRTCFEIRRGDEYDLGPERSKDHLREDGQRRSIEVLDSVTVASVKGRTHREPINKSASLS
jgi:hypothetical protein